VAPTTSPPPPTSTPIVPTPTSTCTNPVCHRDWDTDGYGDPGVANNTGCASCVAGYVIDNSDCCDNNNLIRPGSAYYSTPHASCVGVGSTWDYDCSGTVTFAVGATSVSLAGRLKSGGYFRYRGPDCAGWSPSETGYLGFDAQYITQADCGKNYYLCDDEDLSVFDDGQVYSRKSATGVCENITPYWMTAPGVCTSLGWQQTVKCR
jgi:hypothetical protein